MTQAEITVDLLLKQEQDYQFATFSHQMALKIGQQLAAKAISDNLAITIDITRCEQRIFFYAHQGTSIDNERWIERKQNLCKRFAHSSLLMKLTIKDYPEDSFGPNAVILDDNYALAGGCFPVIIKDTGMIGTITVSGLADIDDHNLIISVLEQIIPYSTSQETL